MNAEQYLDMALGGNMNIATLKPLAWHEIMEAYAKHVLAQALKPVDDTSLRELAKKEIDEYLDMGCFSNPEHMRPPLIEGFTFGFRAAEKTFNKGV